MAVTHTYIINFLMINIIEMVENKSVVFIQVCSIQDEHLTMLRTMLAAMWLLVKSQKSWQVTGRYQAQTCCHLGRLRSFKHDRNASQNQILWPKAG